MIYTWETNERLTDSRTGQERPQIHQFDLGGYRVSGPDFDIDSGQPARNNELS